MLCSHADEVCFQNGGDAMREQISTITREQALAICARPEDQFFDRKAKAANGRTAQKIAVAFGNTEGGEIAFGIKDDSDEPDPQKRLDPFPDPEAANAIL
jgi:ATP-dependent DNA helicase RecG